MNMLQYNKGSDHMQAVIFDFDGLLVNSEVVSLQIYQELLKPFHIEFSKETYTKYYSGHTEIKNIELFLKSYPLPYNFDECYALVKKLEAQIMAKGVELKTGVITILDYLKQKQIKIALATSSSKQRAMKILKQHHIDHYFDCFIFGNDVENSKPAPDIFLKACDKLNLDSNECFVFEDSELGILAAYQANIKVICIPDMKIPRKEYLDKCEACFKSLDEALPFLKESINVIE